jgi:hypothetical protein
MTPLSYTHIRSRYGLSKDQYDALLERQGGVCVGCGLLPRGGGKGNANGKLFVDHDHETDDIRGLLCQGCNAAVGLVYDSPSTLRKLAAYLERGPVVKKEDLAGPSKPGSYQRGKTCCAQGHPYSEENTYISPSTGHRLCRTCQKAHDKKRRSKQPKPKRTHCRNGHEINNTNTCRLADGRLRCRICATVRQRLYRRRLSELT